MKKLMNIALVTAALMLAVNSQAQNIVPTPATIPVLAGMPFTYQGQTFLISTNASGGLDVSTFGIQGTNILTVPVNPQQAMEVASAWIGANNPANINYYGTNEWDARLGAGYIQNSGQAVAVLSVLKYGLFGWANVGFGGGILQGNNQGKSGTAGGYGEITYRKPIGDVAGVFGAQGGYDNWNHKIFGAVKAGLEYRQSAHLGEFLDAAWAFESTKSDRGLLIFGGICYAF